MFIKSHLGMNASQAFYLPCLLFQNPHLPLMIHEKEKKKTKKPPLPQSDVRLLFSTDFLFRQLGKLANSQRFGFLVGLGVH